MSSHVYCTQLDHTTHERLRNWARCFRGGGPSPGTCGSAEGLYRRRDDPELPQGPRTIRRPVVLDYDDAETVDRVIRGQTFPVRERTLIEAHYLREERFEKTCRVLGIAFRRYEEAVAGAVLMVRNRLALFHEGPH